MTDGSTERVPGLTYVDRVYRMLMSLSGDQEMPKPIYRERLHGALLVAKFELEFICRIDEKGWRLDQLDPTALELFRSTTRKGRDRMAAFAPRLKSGRVSTQVMWDELWMAINVFDTLRLYLQNSFRYRGAA
jgi:hypothetical protein